MKKFVAVFMALLLLFTPAPCVHATETEETTEHPRTTEYPNEPDRQPDLVSVAAIVMDVNSGQILFEKNAYDRHYPASITKIMTTLLALEKKVNFDEVITMSENAIWGIERDSTNIGLDVGEKVTMRDLLYATMVRSANECSYQIAEVLGGNVENFADMMNKKAEQLGCQDTHFVTPNGLHDDDHYTTAYDMALITREALKYDEFREIAGTKSYTIPPTNRSDEPTEFWNGNKMILPASEYYYEYCEGGKTGYTTIAHNTLVTYAKQNDLELICVLLDCDGGAQYAYSDTRALYKYCYNNYSYYYPLSDFSFETEDEDEPQTNPILYNYYMNLNHDMVDLVVDRSYKILVNNALDTTQIAQEVSLYDTAKDNVLGEITFTYDDKLLGTAYITGSNPTLASTINTNMEEEVKPSKGKAVLKVFKTIGLIILCLIVAFGLYLAFAAIVRCVKRNRRRRSYARRRRRKRRDDDYYF